jgi:hypothetical protein
VQGDGEAGGAAGESDGAAATGDAATGEGSGGEAGAGTEMPAEVGADRGTSAAAADGAEHAT